MAEYINNKEFLNLLIEYKKTKNKSTYEKIGKCFIQIVNRLLYRPNFVNYTRNIKTDMISDACFYMVKYIDKFDSKKYDNPFAYFTMIAWNAIVQNINTMKRNSERFLPLDFIENMNEHESTGSEDTIQQKRKQSHNKVSKKYKVDNSILDKFFN